MGSLRPWHLLIGMNVLVLGALAWTTAQSATGPVSDVIRARLIELVNEQGEMRAQLHLGEDGGGNLRLRSGEGEIRVKFGAVEDGAILLMFDQTAEVGVRLARDENGASLTLVDADGVEETIAP